MKRTIGIISGLALVAGLVVFGTTRVRELGSDTASDELAPLQRPGRAISAPKGARGAQQSSSSSRSQGEGRLMFAAEGPSIVELADVPTIEQASGDEVRGGRRIESRFTDADIAAAQKAARKQKKSNAVQNLDGSSLPVGQKPKLEVGFDSIAAADCCDDVAFTATVPPDPDIAVGPNHVIAVVNIAFEIYDKQGNSLTGGPVGFSQFFDPTMGGTMPGTPTPNCPAYTGGLFDPDVVYDAAEDRFIMGIDGAGTDFCIAVSETGDPTGAWYRYAFDADIDGAFFDYPHMGVGDNEIFVGSNQFGGALPFGFQGRVFAVEKANLYSGGVPMVATRELAPPGLEGPANVKLDGTPQPAQSPTGPAHYIMSEFFDGVVHSVYSWEDPFGSDIWTLVGDVDLATASGVPCPFFSCFPVPNPQKGSPEILAANDWRGQETKVHDGLLWTAQTISCNPGKGTRNCIRWAQIDPTAVQPAPDQTAFPLDASTNGVVQAGVFGSDWGYRFFPSLDVNDCGDMAIGYTATEAPGNSGGTTYPSIFVAGRKASDAPGTIGGERRLKKGTEDYTSFQNSGGAGTSRWGDYTGMATYGNEFWYIGEYAGGEPAISTISGNNLANWGTYIGMFTMPGCN